MDIFDQLFWLAAWGLLYAVVFAAVNMALVRVLVPKTADRKNLWDIISARFRRKPVVQEQRPPPNPTPVIPPLPEPVSGNVRPITAEWKAEADGRDAFVFPHRSKPRTRYEDLNRKLVLFNPGVVALAPSRLPYRDTNDYPYSLKCTEASMLAVVAKRIRCAYPVIIDPSGIFASASARLERDPALTSDYVQNYIAIPEEERPVVVSYSPAKKGAEHLLFCRYGFEPATVPVSFLEPYIGTNLDYIFGAFLAGPEIWLWFSLAGMRHNTFVQHEEAELQRLGIVKITNRFAHLWGIVEAKTEDNEAEHVDEAPFVADEPSDVDAADIKHHSGSDASNAAPLP